MNKDDFGKKYLNKKLISFYLKDFTFYMYI